MYFWVCKCPFCSTEVVNQNDLATGNLNSKYNNNGRSCEPCFMIVNLYNFKIVWRKVALKIYRKYSCLRGAGNISSSVFVFCWEHHPMLSQQTTIRWRWRRCWPVNEWPSFRKGLIIDMFEHFIHPFTTHANNPPYFLRTNLICDCL